MRIDHCTLLRVMREDASIELHAVESHQPVGYVAWALEDSWRSGQGMDHPHHSRDKFTLRMITGEIIDPTEIVGRVPLIEMALVDVAPRASAGQV